jgi:hypothetical protein
MSSVWFLISFLTSSLIVARIRIEGEIVRYFDDIARRDEHIEDLLRKRAHL